MVSDVGTVTALVRSSSKASVVEGGVNEMEDESGRVVVGILPSDGSGAVEYDRLFMQGVQEIYPELVQSVEVDVAGNTRYFL